MKTWQLNWVAGRDPFNDILVKLNTCSETTVLRVCKYWPPSQSPTKGSRMDTGNQASLIRNLLCYLVQVFDLSVPSTLSFSHCRHRCPPRQVQGGLLHKPLRPLGDDHHFCTYSRNLSAEEGRTWPGGGEGRGGEGRGGEYEQYATSAIITDIAHVTCI